MEDGETKAEQVCVKAHALRRRIAEATEECQELGLLVGAEDSCEQVHQAWLRMTEAKMWLGKVLELNGEDRVSDEPPRAASELEDEEWRKRGF